MQIDAMVQGEVNVLRPPAVATGQVKRERHSADVDAVQLKSEKKVSPEEVLKRISSLTDGGTHSVHFEMDKDVNMLVIRVYESRTNELIRQIPAESLLETAKAITDYQRGLIVDGKS